MKSKSKKSIPKVRLPKFSPGGSTSYNESLSPDLQTGNSNIDYMNDKRKGTSKYASAGQIAGYAGAVAGGIGQLSSNSSLHGRAKQQADSAAINNTVDSVAGTAVPIYGAGVALKNTVSGMISKDQNGLATEKSTMMMDDAIKPLHTQVIDDATKGDWGAAALDTLSAGMYARVNNYNDYDKNKQANADELKVQQDQAKAEQQAQQTQQDNYNKMYNYYQSNMQKARYGGIKYPNGGMNTQPNASQDMIHAPEMGGYFRRRKK